MVPLHPAIAITPLQGKDGARVQQHWRAAEAMVIQTR
jgi:hypothetical protein